MRIKHKDILSCGRWSVGDLHLNGELDEEFNVAETFDTSKRARSYAKSLFLRDPSHTITRTAMTTTYRVEAHDGHYWRFGIRRSHNSGLPEFCGLHAAENFTTFAEAMRLRDETSRLCGGSLRVASCENQSLRFT